MWPCALLLFQAASSPSFEANVVPLLAAHCVECHAGEKPKGELDLAAWTKAGAAFRFDDERESLARVRERLLQGEMPPPSRPRPAVDAVDSALLWLDGALPRETSQRPTLRRLNRSEYERTVRDLFGVAYPARELFPADGVGAMFDNDAAVASASELAVERWVEAAERVAARALPPEVASTERAFGPKDLELEGKASRSKSSIGIFSAGTASARIDLPRDSRYRVEVTAWGDLAGDELPRLALEVDGRVLGTREVRVEQSAGEVLELTEALAAGAHVVSARFLNDFYDPKNDDPKRRDRNVHVARLCVVGPLDAPPATEFTRALDEALARGSFESTLAWLGLRVWRRPLAAEELARLSALAPAEAPARERLRTALTALLASPHFLYRVESEPSGEALSAFELATRLSYFLWSSAPDDALLAKASDASLLQPEVFARELQRMLRDARSRALVEEFAPQWLGWRVLEHATPDARTFPDADAALLASMRQESEAFFEALLREERPLHEFLDADFTFVDERLAKLYGIEGIQGVGMRRVRLDGRERGGLLGQAAILTATSNPTRTSPVKRGKWILETLLGETVPPPPPGVGALSETPHGVAPKSLREQLDLHRANADCASCHARLDPLGFALEGFDAIGKSRTHEGETAVDARGTLPDGTELDGVQALKNYLRQRGTFARSAARALFSYAMGRAPTRMEQRALERDVDALAAEQQTLAALIEIVARQSAFRNHGGSP